MPLVIDANVLFSFFKEDSSRRKLVINMSLLGEELISPQYCFDELADDKERVKRYSGIDDKQFSKLLSTLETFILPVSETEYLEFAHEAEMLAPHQKDAPYFALALLKNCTIWSDEKAFKKQGKVKVVTTAELLEGLKDF